MCQIAVGVFFFLHIKAIMETVCPDVAPTTTVRNSIFYTQCTLLFKNVQWYYRVIHLNYWLKFNLPTLITIH